MNAKKVLLTCLALRQLLNRLLRRDEKNVGILMPTSVYGALANAALALCGKTSVNLNYTFSSDTLNYCIETAEIKHVITSRKFLAKFPNLELNADLLVLEDISKQMTLTDKIIAKAQSLLPTALLERLLGLTKISPNDLLTIIFTSGSTGKPKGAMLTHNNIAANIFAFCERLHVNVNDCVLGILPLFHSFGFTTTLWLPLSNECSVAYHFNPLEPKKVGEISAKYTCTTMPSTPTFQKAYLHRCSKEQFEKLHTIVCGAEKLPAELAKEWEAKFGHKLVEGYGTTELSPVVSTCSPSNRFPNAESFYREGSIGKPLVNVKVKIVDAESGKEQPTNTPGMLLVKGPSVMKGYYRNPELTTEVFKGGWYVTGDIARQDEDGFLFITGRLSRISKIGGEMVPHILIEETIDKILSRQRNPEQETDGLQIAVTAVPDEKKGERIIVLYRNLAIPPEEIREAMMSEGVPNLWIPSLQSFRQVENIPILGTGKLDLAEIKNMAERLIT
jgi:acyl-[acyl-carrier-protein]-phospholipid O-acyltransferase/long-chain-fatty-acid--[acyl-carrier-protein] ligase